MSRLMMKIQSYNGFERYRLGGPFSKASRPLEWRLSEKKLPKVRFFLKRGRRYKLPWGGASGHRAKFSALGVILLLFVAFFPSPSIFVNEEKPYFGDFSWSSLHAVRLSAGDFREAGRGGLELAVGKLRLIDYAVRQGDTLWTIAKKYDVDPDSIISAGSFGNVHRIREGDVIQVPNMRGIFVDVRPGDTILKMSKKYEVSPDFIVEVNELRSNALSPGMKLFLPGATFSTIERAYALGVAFEKPVRGRLTSRFGYRRDPFSGKRGFHTGVDIAGRQGSEVRAAREGTVSFAGVKFGRGKSIIVVHAFGYKTVYSHLSAVRAGKGQRVKKGEIIGFIGDSGRSTGPHLHFETWHRGKPINPLTQTNMSSR
jgi:murein DD-endopeptidase MepM/ murein hydrolase activator NlpD